MSKTISSLTFFTLIAILSSPVFCLGESSILEKTYGGTGSDGGYDVQQTADGGFIIVGDTTTYGAGQIDGYLLKVDASGVKIWDKTFGGLGDDYGRSIQKTSDGGYIITGATMQLSAGGTDVYLLKVDASGNKIWESTFGGARNDVGLSVQQTSDRGYILVGNTYSFGAGSADIYVVKTDASGNKLWDRTYGGTGFDRGSSIEQTKDGGYIITGSTSSFTLGGTDVYILKINASGNLVWEKNIGGKENDEGNSVHETSDGGYVVAGNTNSFGAGSSDVYLVKVDSSGKKLWEKTYGGKGAEYGSSFKLTSNGGYIITGNTNSFGEGDTDIYLVRADASGNLIWQNTFGDIKTDLGSNVQLTLDGGYVIIGNTYTVSAENVDIYLVKVPPIAFKETNLTINPIKTEVNKPVTVSVLINNVGELSGDYKVDLIVNGITDATATISLGQGAQNIVNFDVNRSIAGSYSVAVGSLKSSFTVVEPSKPATFILTNLSLTPAEVEVNKPASVSVTAKNIGELIGDYTAILKVNGVVEGTIVVNLAPGAQSSISFTTMKTATGTYTVSIGDLSKNLIVKPPAIRLKTLQISKNSVKPSEELEVTAMLENTSDQQKSYELVFSLDGIPKDTSLITINGGKTEVKIVKFSSSIEGVHKITVDEKYVEFEVKKEQPGIDGFPIESIFLGLISAFVLLFFTKKS
jgi:hypothetical protein